MAISKPSWLRTWLDRLNWDIFTWRIYVGDAVEGALDWALEWINNAVTWANNAWVRAGVAWDKALEVGKEAWANLCKETTRIWNYLETWWYNLGGWWETRKPIIQGWIDTALGILGDRIDDVKRDLASLSVTWDSFWRSTWPQLLKDLGALGVKVGNFFTVTLPTLASKLDVGKAFDNFRLEWRDLFNFWGSLGREVMEFFTDPLEWLLGKFTDWFLGPER